MVSQRINQAKKALTRAGFSNARGYPATEADTSRKCYAVVSIHAVTRQYITLSIEMFANCKQGGAACEDAAWAASQEQEQDMAACTIGEISFDGQTGMVTIRILAQWPRNPGCTVMIGSEEVSTLVSCDAVRTATMERFTDPESGEIHQVAGGRLWSITVTDLWPLQNKMPQECTDAFLLQITRPGGAETYADCMWTKISLEQTPVGIIRTRVAQTRQERSIE